MVSNPHLALLGWLSSREAGRPGDTGLGRRDQTAYFAPASPSTTCHTRHVCTHAWHVHIHRHACVHKHLCTLTHSSPSSCPLRCVFQDSVHLQGLSDASMLGKEGLRTHTRRDWREDGQIHGRGDPGSRWLWLATATEAGAEEG